MNHSRNIKEMLGIPTGSSDKTLHRNVANSGHSSFTDSQFLFGSQFWPENSQGLSQDMSLSSRTSQQSSQEGSDSKFSSNYPTKPLLFGEFKSKAFGILDQFEDEKRRAKEKTDGEVFAKERNNFRETLNNIQQLLVSTERNTAVCQPVLTKFDNFVSTLQNHLSSLQGDISLQFETLLTTVNSQKERITGVEETTQKSSETTAELGSNLQSLKNSLETLRDEHERERNMLEQALKLLSTLVSEHSAKCGPKRVTDNAIQTSPELLQQQFSTILQDNKLQGTHFRQKSHNTEHNTAEVPPQPPRCTAKRKSSLRSHNKRKKTPLVPSQRSRCTDTKENRNPLKSCDRQQNVSTILDECQHPNAVTSAESDNPDCLQMPNAEMESIATGCFITPLSCWSQESNSPECTAGFEPILEKLSSESKRRIPETPEGLWQLFDFDFDLGL
ncbi:interactor of HORMAD1 protein 1 isoform X1 [Gasterosteus aculeatus]